MTIERMLGLTLAVGAVAFAGVCWAAGLYPHAPHTVEHPSTTALRGEMLDEIDWHLVTLAQIHNDMIRIQQRRATWTGGR
jgi:hypothetical protein